MQLADRMHMVLLLFPHYLLSCSKKVFELDCSQVLNHHTVSGCTGEKEVG
jgi:hypothetical protein